MRILLSFCVLEYFNIPLGVIFFISSEYSLVKVTIVGGRLWTEIYMKILHKEHRGIFT